MDEKALEEIQFHQETISRDGASPLHLIREKEMEISGRVMKARREAEDFIAAARRKTVEMTTQADEEGERLAAERAEALVKEAEREVEKVRKEAEKDVASLEGRIAEEETKAVSFLLDAVKTV